MVPNRRCAASPPSPPSHDSTEVVRALDDVYEYIMSVGARFIAERYQDDIAHPPTTTDGERGAPATGEPHPEAPADAEFRTTRD